VEPLQYDTFEFIQARVCILSTLVLSTWYLVLRPDGQNEQRQE